MKFKAYIDELLKWNRIHKLTNYNSVDKLKEQIEDSIYPIKFLGEFNSLMDIGTGAGFPGIPLAIKLPDVKFYLVEPLQKRYSFLNYIRLMLDLRNIEVIPKRVESIEPFGVDVITSRAVTDTKMLLKLSKPFFTENSKMLLYKGESVEDELNGIENVEIYNNGVRNYVVLKDIKC